MERIIDRGMAPAVESSVETSMESSHGNPSRGSDPVHGDYGHGVSDESAGYEFAMDANSCGTKPIDIVYQDRKIERKGVQNRDVEEGGDWRGRGQVLVEGFVEETQARDDPPGGGTESPKAFCRAKSLTDEDLDELKGCLDLGFGFSYDEIPELCNTLPALELCYSITQKFQDDQQRSPACNGDGAMSDTSSNGSCAQSPIANWKISSPGDRPEQVKARLKFWAQAVACTVRLCS